MRYLLLNLMMLAFISGRSQPPGYTVSNAHSHNDYRQNVPFYDAYHAGFGSIEADIFLVKDQLLVAHDENELNTAPTFKSLYLDPLSRAVASHEGFAFDDSSKQLVLLIDIKSDAISTLNRLIEILSAYPLITGSEKVKLVITGNRPDGSKFPAYPSFIYFDGRPNESYNRESIKRVLMISDNLNNYTSWRGKGKISEVNQKQLKELIGKVHASGKLIRFWNAPDFENAWIQMMNLGVDLINTDHIQALSQFLSRSNQCTKLRRQIE